MYQHLANEIFKALKWIPVYQINIANIIPKLKIKHQHEI
jgi:hypothetical protein